MDLLWAILTFALIVVLTFLNGYWLVTLDELELDHLNPADVARKLNRLVYPEMIAHGVLMAILVVSWSPWLFLINLPIAVWHGYRVARQEEMLDPTEILRFKNLRQARMEAIFKTIFYGFQIVYGMYWLVTAIVQATKLNRRKSRRNP